MLDKTLVPSAESLTNFPHLPLERKRGEFWRIRGGSRHGEWAMMRELLNSHRAPLVAFAGGGCTTTKQTSARVTIGSGTPMSVLNRAFGSTHGPCPLPHLHPGVADPVAGDGFPGAAGRSASTLGGGMAVHSSSLRSAAIRSFDPCGKAVAGLRHHGCRRTRRAVF